MSNSKDLPKDLPLMEHEFTIDVIGEMTKKRYVGEFKFRIPNLKQKCLADKKRAELNGGLEKDLDPSILTLHYIVSYLRYSLETVPKWWAESDYGYNLYDFNVINEVFKITEKFEEDYMKELWGTKEDGESEKE